MLSKKNIGLWGWRLPDFDPGGSRGRHYFINRIYLIRPSLDYCGERPANRSLTLHLHIQSGRLWTVELYTLVTVSRVRLLLMPISFSMPHADLILLSLFSFPKISTIKIVLAFHTLTGQVISNKLGKLLIIKSNMGHITEWDAEQLRHGSSRLTLNRLVCAPLSQQGPLYKMDRDHCWTILVTVTLDTSWKMAFTGKD